MSTKINCQFTKWENRSNDYYRSIYFILYLLLMKLHLKLLNLLVTDLLMFRNVPRDRYIAVLNNRPLCQRATASTKKITDRYRSCWRGCSSFSVTFTTLSWEEQIRSATSWTASGPFSCCLFSPLSRRHASTSAIQSGVFVRLTSLPAKLITLRRHVQYLFSSIGLIYWPVDNSIFDCIF